MLANEYPIIKSLNIDKIQLLCHEYSKNAPCKHDLPNINHDTCFLSYYFMVNLFFSEFFGISIVFVFTLTYSFLSSSSHLRLFYGTCSSLLTDLMLIMVRLLTFKKIPYVFIKELFPRYNHNDVSRKFKQHTIVLYVPKDSGNNSIVLRMIIN